MYCLKTSLAFKRRQGCQFFCIVVRTLGTCGRGNDTAIKKCIIQQVPGPGDGDLLRLLANSFCGDSAVFIFNIIS